MPDFKVIWTKRSRSDLENIFDFAYKLSPRFARSLIFRITSRQDQLSSFPKSGRIEDLLSSEVLEYRFIVEGNYKIIYRIKGGDVVVIRVFDTRQNPQRLSI